MTGSNTDCEVGRICPQSAALVIPCVVRPFQDRRPVAARFGGLHPERLASGPSAACLSGQVSCISSISWFPQGDGGLRSEVRRRRSDARGRRAEDREQRSEGRSRTAEAGCLRPSAVMEARARFRVFSGCLARVVAGRCRQRNAAAGRGASHTPRGSVPDIRGPAGPSPVRWPACWR
jgi:hypothetical protein